MILAFSIIVIVILVVVVVVVLVNAEDQGNLAIVSIRGQINSPIHAATVPREISCSGTIQNQPPFGDYDFWLAVEVDGLIWPKAAVTAPDADGDWEQTIFEGGSPASFSISLWAADPAGTRQIQAWQEHGKQTNDFPGLSTLPGAKKLAQVSGLRLVD